MNHAPGAVTPLDPEMVQVGDAVGLRAEWRGLFKLSGGSVHEALKLVSRCHSRNSPEGRSPAPWEGNRVPGTLVELLAVGEFLTQPRTDVQPVARVHAEVTVIEERVHVGPEQQSVVEPVLTAVCHRSDMGCPQDGPDLRAGDGASAAVCHQHPGFEGLLAKPLRRHPWIAEDRTLLVPGTGKVDVDCMAKHPLDEIAEVRCRGSPLRS